MARTQMTKAAFSTYLMTAAFEKVDDSGDRPVVVVRTKDQYAADWLNKQNGLRLIVSHLGGAAADLYARPKH